MPLMAPPGPSTKTKRRGRCSAKQRRSPGRPPAELSGLFHGGYQTTLPQDVSDNRIRLPLAFQKAFEQVGARRLWATQKPRAAAWLLCPDCTWPDCVEWILGKYSKRAREAVRLRYVDSAHPVPVTAQCRVTIPPEMRERLAGSTHVFLVGVGGWIEVWPLEEWDKLSENIETA